jgi:predicted DNA-binding protein (UPF0251 family)
VKESEGTKLREEIKGRLKELGITQEEAGRILGYSNGSLRRIVYTNAPSALRKIAKSLENYQKARRLKARLIEKMEALKQMGVSTEEHAIDRIEKNTAKLSGAELIKRIGDISDMGRPSIAREVGMSKTALYHNRLGNPTRRAIELLYLKKLYETILRTLSR